MATLLQVLHQRDRRKEAVGVQEAVLVVVVL